VAEDSGCMKQSKEETVRQVPGRRPQFDGPRRQVAGKAGRGPSVRGSGLEALAVAGGPVTLEKGEILVKEGQSGDEDFLVVSGALMLFKSLPPDRWSPCAAAPRPGRSRCGP
jgi:hypothetical protein